MKLSVRLRFFPYSLFVLWSAHVLSVEVGTRGPSYYRIPRQAEQYEVDPNDPNAEYAAFIVKVVAQDSVFTGVISGTSSVFSDPSIYDMASANVCLLNGKCEQVHRMNIYRGTYFTLLIIGEPIGEQTQKTEHVVDVQCFAVGIHHIPEEVTLDLGEDFAYHVTSKKKLQPNDAVICDSKQAGILRPVKNGKFIMETSLRIWSEAQVLPKWYIAALGLLGELDRLEVSTVIARRSLTEDGAVRGTVSSFLIIALISLTLRIL
ncbi:hypothetical protein Trydic_g3787 [Trypoxylus dichotomus]